MRLWHGRVDVQCFSELFFGGVQAPVLQVFIFVGALFIVVNLLLSRLSRRLEVREQRRTSGPQLKPALGDQAA